jgi:trk system potassium uptake protein TrkA
MNVIVVGCGRVGSQLAYQLSKKGNQVTVIDQVASAFKNLPADFVGRKVEGELLSQDVLRRAGIEQAEGLAAVTNSDPFNAVVAHLARTAFRVPKVVVRNFDPHWQPLHETFGFQVISSSIWTAQRAEELLSEAPLRPVFSPGNGGVKIWELTLPEDWHGRRVQELVAEGQCLPVALTRAGRAYMVSPEMPLEAGDLVYLSATLEGIQEVRNRLNLPQEV